MQSYSLIPASVTSNIKHGKCLITDDGKLEISLDIFSLPDADNVYKACACDIHNQTESLNLGTFMEENNVCRLVSDLSFDTESSVIVIYLKDTKTQDMTPQSYLLLNDRPVLDICAEKNELGLFSVICTFEDECETEAEDTSAIENAQKALDDYTYMHPPSDVSLGINKKYYDKLLTELESFEPFSWVEDTFNWFRINTFTVPSNLSSVKYVLFDTLSINAFDTHKHYLFGVKNASPDSDSYYIAVALPAVSNPLTHLNGYSKEIPYDENYNYYVVYIELAPDGQYFLGDEYEI